jgi:hypothetical protein
MRVQARITSELGRDVAVLELFRHPTVRDLARFLGGEIVPVQRHDGGERARKRRAAREREAR